MLQKTLCFRSNCKRDAHAVSLFLSVKTGFSISFATMLEKEETIMTLKEKLELWVKITGVDPNQTNYSIRFDGGLSS